MPVLGLLLLAGVFVTSAMLLTRKSDASSPLALPPDGKVGRFFGLLRKGQLYRVWARVPSETMTQTDLQAKVGQMGFGDFKLITPDPTDRSVATLIARWRLDSSEAFDTPEVQLFQLQAVEEPPANVKTSGDESLNPAAIVLDGGLTRQEIEALAWALINDEDAKHLGGFASTFEPDFPIASSLLRAKAALANSRSMGSVLSEQLRAKNEKLRDRFVRAAHVVGIGHGASAWVQKLSSNTVDTLLRLTKGLVPDATWEKYRPSSHALGTFFPAQRMWMSDQALSALKQILEAPRDAGEEGEAFAKRVGEACPALAMVPGLGSGVACMRKAGAALSLTTPLEDVNMQDVAQCFDESGQVAFLTAATLVGDFARGKPAPAEGLFATLASEREPMTDHEKIAFDAGIALGFARALQATDFPALWSYVQGSTLSQRALAFAVAVGQAKREKKRTVVVLLQKIAAKLPVSSLDAVRSVAVDLLQHEDLLQRYPAELASKKSVPLAVAEAAMAIVREIGEGVRIVDPHALRLLFPDEPTFQLGLTPTVLKLAMSLNKPYMSQVVDPAGIVPKVKAIASSETTEGAKARQQLERAMKTLERQRWADWYRKVRSERASREPLAGGQLTRRAG